MQKGQEMTYEELLEEINKNTEANHKALAAIVRMCQFGGPGNMVATELVVNLIQLELSKARI